MIRLSGERKKLCVSVGVNFFLGIVVGAMLFYAHIKSGQEMLSKDLYYEKNVNTLDVLRVGWLNAMWMFSVFMAHTVIPVGAFHIVIGVRGAVNSFSLLYLIYMFGVKKAIVSVLPQCVSVLPMLMWFSVLCVERRKMRSMDGKDMFCLVRKDTLLIFFCSALAAAMEVFVFTFLGKILL